MAITTTAVSTCEFTWTNVDTTDGRARLTDIGAITVENSLLNATGSGAIAQTGLNKINTLWHNTATLTAGGRNMLNLWSLTRTIFSATETISFSGGQVRVIIIENQASGSGANIAVNAPSSSGFLSPFYGASSGIIISPTASCVLANPRFGWPVTTGNHYVEIIDIGGSGAGYRIAIGGVV